MQDMSLSNILCDKMLYLSLPIVFIMGKSNWSNVFIEKQMNILTCEIFEDYEKDHSERMKENFIRGKKTVWIKIRINTTSKIISSTF
jgi:hypothetical protein